MKFHPRFTTALGEQDPREHMPYKRPACTQCHGLGDHPLIIDGGATFVDCDRCGSTGCEPRFPNKWRKKERMRRRAFFAARKHKLNPTTVLSEDECNEMAWEHGIYAEWHEGGWGFECECCGSEADYGDHRLPERVTDMGGHLCDYGWCETWNEHWKCGFCGTVGIFHNASM